MNTVTTCHLTIRGHVQGVGYRYFLAAEAQRLGVCGWVRNRVDGSVEAVVQGTPPAVSAMIELAHRGPRAAHVSEVEECSDSGAQSFRTFEIRATV